jgi:hypothetical protein
MRFNIGKPGFLEGALTAAAAVGALMLATWQLASQPVPPAAGQLAKEVDFLTRELTMLNRRLDRLRARNTVLEREADVMRRANRILREEESDRRARLDQQQSELDFFRRLAGTGGEQSGLDVYHAEILPTDSERVFRFMLTLTQNIRRASIVSGKARIDIEGTMEDRPVTLYWSRISGDEAPEPTFRFKYFQQIEGYLSLPEGFSPTRLRLTLEAGERRKPVQRGYDWHSLLNGGAHPPAPADH